METEKKMTTDAIEAYVKQGSAFQDHVKALGEEHNVVLKGVDGFTAPAEAYAFDSQIPRQSLEAAGIMPIQKLIVLPDLDSSKSKIKQLRDDMLTLKHKIALAEIAANSDRTMSEVFKSNLEFYEARLKAAQSAVDKEMRDLEKVEDSYRERQAELKAKESELHETIDLINFYSDEDTMPEWEKPFYKSIEQEIESEKAKIEENLDRGFTRIESTEGYKRTVNESEHCKDSIEEIIELYHETIPELTEDVDSLNNSIAAFQHNEETQMMQYQAFVKKCETVIADLKQRSIEPEVSETEKADIKVQVENLQKQKADAKKFRSENHRRFRENSRIYAAKYGSAKDALVDAQDLLTELQATIQKCIDKGVTVDDKPVTAAMVYDMVVQHGISDEQAVFVKVQQEAKREFEAAQQAFIATQSKVLTIENTLKEETIKNSSALNSAKKSLEEAEKILKKAEALEPELEKSLDLAEKNLDMATHNIEEAHEKIAELKKEYEDAKPSDFDGEVDEDGNPISVEQKESLLKARQQKLEEELSDQHENHSDAIEDKAVATKSRNDLERSISENNEIKANAEEKVDHLKSDAGQEGSVEYHKVELQEARTKAIEFGANKLTVLNDAEEQLAKAKAKLEAAEADLDSNAGTSFQATIVFSDKPGAFEGDGNIKMTADGADKVEVEIPKWVVELYLNTRQASQIGIPDPSDTAAWSKYWKSRLDGAPDASAIATNDDTFELIDVEKDINSVKAATEDGTGNLDGTP